MFKVDNISLINARFEKGLNVQDVVRATEISRMTIYRLEKGTCKHPQAKTIKILAKLYGKKISELLVRR